MIILPEFFRLRTALPPRCRNVAQHVISQDSHRAQHGAAKPALLPNAQPPPPPPPSRGIIHARLRGAISQKPARRPWRRRGLRVAPRSVRTNLRENLWSYGGLWHWPRHPRTCCGFAYAVFRSGRPLLLWYAVSPSRCPNHAEVIYHAYRPSFIKGPPRQFLFCSSHDPNCRKLLGEGSDNGRKVLKISSSASTSRHTTAGHRRARLPSFYFALSFFFLFLFFLLFYLLPPRFIVNLRASYSLPIAMHITPTRCVRADPDRGGKTARKRIREAACFEMGIIREFADVGRCSEPSIASPSTGAAQDQEEGGGGREEMRRKKT